MAGNSIEQLRDGVIQKWKLHRESVRNTPLRTREEKRREAQRLARAFAVIAMICGMLITFILPPFCAPDEHVHFINAYSMSKGELFAQEYEGRLVRWVPTYFTSYLKNYSDPLIGVENTNRFNAQDIYRGTSDSWKLVDDTPYPYTTDITSTGYLVSSLSMAVGTQIGLLLHSDNVLFPYNQMLMGRIGNLFFYVLVIYFAIKRAPHYNKTIMLLALMPMSLFLGASLSYDAVLIPVSLYFFALVLDLHAEPEKRISTRDVLKVMLCVFLISGMKFGAYIPLLAMLLTVPKTKYGSTKRMLLCIGAVVLMVGIGYLPTMILNNMKAGLVSYNEANSAAAAQREWMGSHLTSIPDVFGTTIYKNGVVWLYGFWGLLGWLDTYFPIPIMLLGVVIVVVMALLETSSFHLWQEKRWKNLLALLGALVSAIGIMLAMYINHTTLFGEGIGGAWIDGVQGRYFIPLAMGFALAASNPILLKVSGFRNGTADRRLGHGAILWGACCGTMAVVILLMKYWI